MKHIETFGILGWAACGLVMSVEVPVAAQPTVQVVWEAPATRPLLNSTGVALSAGLATDGDGVLLELGYYDAGTVASPFSGKFVALTGGSSADAALRSTSVGDSGGGAAGTFSLSTNFEAGAAVFQGAPPAAGTPLVIRFFDGKTVATSSHYNVVSGGANWLWKEPMEAPGAFVILSMADAGLVWLGGSASSFKTTLPGPPPEKNTGSGGGGVSEELPAIIGAALTLNIPEERKASTYRSSSLPPGLRLNTTTGVLSGVPTVAGSYRVLVTPYTASGVAQTPVEFKIQVAPLSPGVVGKFSGLVERSPSLNANLGASLQLTTTATGLYSGRLLVGTRSYSLRGRLEVDAARPTGASLVIPLPQLGANVGLTLDLDGPSQAFTGTLSDAASAVPVQGWQTPWTASLPATNLQGNYAYRLSSKDSSRSVPQGYGYGTLKVVAASGLASLTTTLADGTRIVGSTLLGKDGEVAVYSSLTSASLVGLLALKGGTAASGLNTLAGTLSWLRPAVAGTVYAAGFGPADLDTAGGTLLPVAKGNLVPAFDPVSAAFPLNAVLTFANGGLDAESRAFSRPLAVKSVASADKNIATIPTGTPSTTLSVLTPSTGAFAGTFLMAGSSAATNRTVRFQGQFVTIEGKTQGYGYFLMPTLPSGSLNLATTPKLSGSVLLGKP